MWRWVKFCKMAALLAFLLPWLTVSCSNQKIASPNGFQLMIGWYSISNPMTGVIENVTGPPVLLLGATLAVLVIGLWLAFSKSADDSFPMVVAGTSFGSMIMVWLATNSIDSLTITRAAAEKLGNVQSQLASTIIRVDYAFGFWIVIVSLAAATFFAAQASSDEVSVGALADRLSNLAAAGGTAGGDVAHWDKIADKNEPDNLQEYLIRYPAGKFADLARVKLARMNIEPLVAAPASVAASAVSSPPATEPEPVVAIRTCSECGARYSGDRNYCTADGSALT